MRVVIVGAGFAGLRLARMLKNKAGFDILLIDKFNYHQFQPLFYQVATSALDASNISFPLRKVFQNSKNVRIRITELKSIEADAQKVVTDSGEIPYDVLVLATGADTNFFGNQKIAANAFPMKSTVESLQLRHRLIQNFEDALAAKSVDEVKRLLNVVIVGGGPTGVEVAGALAEMKRYVLPKDYPELDFTNMGIYLVESGDRTLGNMSEKSSEDSCNYLHKLGVTVMTKTMVKDYDGEQVLLGDGKTIPTGTVIWAAGIKGNLPEGVQPELVVRGNRIKVDHFNKMLGSQNIYVLGDLASMIDVAEWPTGHPQVASVAIAQADRLSKNLQRLSQNKAPEGFVYHDKGSMATVGRNLAVVDIPKPKLHFRGLLAWFIWMALHLFLILGVKNRIVVFINWIYSYITYDQSLRLIFKEFYRPKQPIDESKQEQMNAATQAIQKPVAQPG